MSNCSLDSLHSLGELWSLKTLKVSKNQITLIPDVFSNLGRLEILDISNNIVEFIHPGMCSCTSLRVLDLR
jgi:Leucine-rich repeat (LRR) protein